MKRSPAGGWQYIDRSYTAAGNGPAIVSPTADSMLNAITQTFNCTDGLEVANQWWFYAGATVGGKDYADSGKLASALSYTLDTSSIPTLSTVYVRLWYHTNTGWSYIDSEYTSAESELMSQSLQQMQQMQQLLPNSQLQRSELQPARETRLQPSGVATR